MSSRRRVENPMRGSYSYLFLSSFSCDAPPQLVAEDYELPLRVRRDVPDFPHLPAADGARMLFADFAVPGLFGGKSENSTADPHVGIALLSGEDSVEA